jgi:hypothetical protein
MLGRSQREQDWRTLGTLLKETTGRTLIGTNGGLYAFTSEEIRIPRLDIEAGIHELCHWVVASPEERKQDNMGLSTDWTHPRFDRMVKCEELAWSLEFYLFGDPTAEKMSSLLTPEARSSGGGGVNSGYQISYGHRAPDYIPLEEAAKAELERGKRLVEREAEKLRQEALQKAEAAQLRVKDLKALIQSTIARQEEASKMLPDLERELRALEGPESPHCPAVKDGFTCDRTGNHVEHASEDVRGKVLFTWRDSEQLAQRMRKLGRDLAQAQTSDYVRNALVDLSTNRPGLDFEPPVVKKECSRCHHIHRGETRETTADQCGYPCRTENAGGRMLTDSDYWWCQCYGDDPILP